MNNSLKLAAIFVLLAAILYFFVNLVKGKPVEPPAEVTLFFKQGWQLMGFPDFLAGKSFSEIFGDIYFQVVEWTGTAYVSASIIEINKGYWILVLEDVQVTVVL